MPERGMEQQNLALPVFLLRMNTFTSSGAARAVKSVIVICLIFSVLAAPTQALLSNIANACVGVGHSCAVNTSGAAFCWGYNYYNQVLPLFHHYIPVVSEECIHTSVLRHDSSNTVTDR